MQAASGEAGCQPEGKRKRTEYPTQCPAWHILSHLPRAPASSSFHWLESEGADLCTPATLTAIVGPRTGAEGVGGAGPGLPLPTLPQEGLYLFTSIQFISLPAVPAIVDHIPTFSLAPSLLLTVKFSRAAGAPGWFPGVPVKVFRMKEACFSDF